MGRGQGRDKTRNLDKNPIENVGFRGIGIYSAFNLCDSVEIFTKKEGTSAGWRITFKFGMSARTLKEQNAESVACPQTVPRSSSVRLSQWSATRRTLSPIAEHALS